MAVYREIMSFYSKIKEDEFHRYKSWEHCYQYFNKKRLIDFEYGSLHLAFFLASWGMYRGSSDLLWKDYRIHKKPIKYLLKEKAKIRKISYLDEKKRNENITYLLELNENLAKIYRKEITIVDGEEKQINVSDTLTSKILLGMFGCMPAFDRYFISGLHEINSETYSLNYRTLDYLFDFLEEENESLIRVQNEIKRISQLKYPAMKLVDMYIWEKGKVREDRMEKEKRSKIDKHEET